MSSSDKAGAKVRDVRFHGSSMSVDLADGRTITVPVEWYPRLARATSAQRMNWVPSAGGYGIHWPDVDEDLSTEGLLAGAPSPEWRRSSRV